jgi:hypothetical protein
MVAILNFDLLYFIPKTTLQNNVDTSILEAWIGNIKELEVIWESKIVDLSQKR